MSTLRILHLIQSEIDQLKALRRKLCGYVNSDKFCDCKRLGVMQTGGERTGCCEVREAIAKLETVATAMIGPGPLGPPGPVPDGGGPCCGNYKELDSVGCTKPKGHEGNCGSA